MIGKRFVRLVVEKYSHSSKKQRNWICRCDCGRHITTTTNCLNSGNTRSCGCLQRECASFNGKGSGKHGLSKINGKKTRLFRIWTGMKTRCYNSNNKAFLKYGGRGISICNKWLDFKNFHNWAMTNGYNDSLSIDRIDVNGNYEPSNCRWATSKEQANNRTNSKVFVVNGIELTIRDIAIKLNVTIQSIHGRIKRGQTESQIINLVVSHDKELIIK